MSDGSLSDEEIDALLFGDLAIGSKDEIYSQIDKIKQDESNELNLCSAFRFLNLGSNLCWEMKFDTKSFAGDFDQRITHFIHHLELRKSNPVRALKEVLLKLCPKFRDEILRL